MSNLGLDQDVVTEMARSGGVEAWIDQVERGAVAKASPRAFLAGAGFTGVLVLAVWATNHLVERRRADLLLASEARESLTELYEQSTQATPDDEQPDDDPTDGEEPPQPQG